jgi:hypothetical protein
MSPESPQSLGLGGMSQQKKRASEEINPSLSDGDYLDGWTPLGVA